MMINVFDWLADAFVTIGSPVLMLFQTLADNCARRSSRLFDVLNEPLIAGLSSGRGASPSDGGCVNAGEVSNADVIIGSSASVIGGVGMSGAAEISG